VSIRGDSTWDVPEPELALVLNSRLEIVGYTVGNDMSSRSIEGENPLYLPQAKVYTGACALGPVVTLATGDVDPLGLEISMTITRGAQAVFTGTTSTAELHRTLDDLTAYLGRYNTFPHGAVLLTGTGLVPPSSFTLQDGDEVTITITSIGTLHNPVQRLA
jgi:2-dehydro-3-deoxy-D-arabinonate dehydratase